MNNNHSAQNNQVLKPVQRIQTYLRKISQTYNEIPLIIPDGIYGPETKAAVTAFQQLFGLPVTGEVDLNTWELIIFVFQNLMKTSEDPYPISPYPYSVLCQNCVIGPCSEGDIVLILQTMLGAIKRVFADFEPVQTTGLYDDQTASQIKTFQQRAGLNPTGEVDKETWNSLASFYNLYGVD